jgi:hypothetical protein
MAMVNGRDRRSLRPTLAALGRDTDRAGLLWTDWLITDQHRL